MLNPTTHCALLTSVKQAETDGFDKIPSNKLSGIRQEEALKDAVVIFFLEVTKRYMSPEIPLVMMDVARFVGYTESDIQLV